MKWPWSKTKTPASVEPKPIEITLVTVVGDWKMRSICHCGYDRGDSFSALCPKCGCYGEWKTLIAREEWEEAQMPSTPLFVPSWVFNLKRNLRTVAWTPKHCTVAGIEAETQDGVKA